MQKIVRSRSRQAWRCDTCSFDNLMLLDKCEMCDTDKPQKYSKSDELKTQKIDEVKQQTQASEKKNVLICNFNKCKAQNNVNQIKCYKCGRFLCEELNQDFDNEQQQQPKLSSKKQAQKVQMAICHKCRFQNDPSNIMCVNCDIRMRKKRVPRKPKVYAGRRGFGGTHMCGICNTYKIPQMDGTTQCQCPEPDDGTPLHKSICNFCFQNLPYGKYDQHISKCQQRDSFFDRNKNKTFQRCSKLQIDTILYMQRSCQVKHFNKQKKLQKKIQKLGFTKKDIQNLYHYVVNYAPIIIHMHANNHMQFFVKDTHYRNQFQTRLSSGSLSSSSRTNWQDRMFDKMHHDAKPFERVKYGTMNFTNDPHGVAACTSYGQSYFLLKEHVRDRCTMTDMDSSSPNSTICTFRFCFHLLCKLNDKQIEAAIGASKAAEVKSAGIISAYKQIQIHGPVQFSKDIQRVYVSKAEIQANPKCLQMVKQFCEKNDLEYEEFGQVPPPVAHIPGGGFGGGGIFGGGGMPAGGFFGAHSPISGFGAPSISHSAFGTSYAYRKPIKAPPIKYARVSFPYSSHVQDQDQDQDQDDEQKWQQFQQQKDDYI